jgi:hypothetical protein
MIKKKTQKPKKNKKTQMLPSLHGVAEKEALKDLLKSPPMPKEEESDKK